LFDKAFDFCYNPYRSKRKAGAKHGRKKGENKMKTKTEEQKRGNETPEQMLAAISQEEQVIVLRTAVIRAHAKFLKAEKKYEEAKAARQMIMGKLKAVDFGAALDVAQEIFRI
jgi:hypothetical protein